MGFPTLNNLNNQILYPDILIFLFSSTIEYLIHNIKSVLRIKRIELL